MLPCRRVALLAATAFAVLVTAPAADAEPTPFGHRCTAQDGVRFCPTTDLAARVRSWDGVPLDVDVTLPPTGDGPFPTILLLHGLGGTKTTFEGTGGDPLYNNVAFARRGYAVVTPTARGFGNSCGKALAGTPGCGRAWTRLNDIRYEIRDIQWLAGLLVDDGIANRKRIGATGVSYGGGASTMLAFLRNRIVRPDGRLAPWRSPRGRRIRLAAAWPRWLWTNGEGIFARNGRGGWTRKPEGVPVDAWADAIFGVANSGLVAPLGSELSVDVNRWKQLLDRGRSGRRVTAVLTNAFRYHGVGSLEGMASPILFQTGWTDALFPVPQALAGYRALRRRDPGAPVAMQIGDLGHGAANHPLDTVRFNRQGIRFLDAWLRGRGRPPRPGKVTAFTQKCPRHARAGGGPFVARNFGSLARRKEVFGTRQTLRITSAGASGALAAALNPVGGNFCTPQPPDPTSTATFSRRSRGVTLMGLPVLTGRVNTKGRYGQLDARIWDLDPQTDTQRLVTRGAYRLEDNERGRFRFVLDGNGWRFANGHRIVVELLGRDAPTYLPSPTRFSARLSRLKISLPIR
jgi:X-Pro dipeptidyl-peptidase (S15 family)